MDNIFRWKYANLWFSSYRMNVECVTEWERERMNGCLIGFFFSFEDNAIIFLRRLKLLVPFVYCNFCRRKSIDIFIVRIYQNTFCLFICSLTLAPTLSFTRHHQNTFSSCTRQYWAPVYLFGNFFLRRLHFINTYQWKRMPERNKIHEKMKWIQIRYWNRRWCRRRHCERNALWSPWMIQPLCSISSGHYSTTIIKSLLNILVWKKKWAVITAANLIKNHFHIHLMFPSFFRSNK